MHLKCDKNKRNFNLFFSSCLTCLREGYRLRRAVTELYTPVGCLNLTAMEANKLQGFIRARAASPLHKRKTFCTAPSDWSSRIHWVWRMQIQSCALTSRREQATQQITYIGYYQYSQYGVVQCSIKHIFISLIICIMMIATGVIHKCDRLHNKPQSSGCKSQSS